MPTVLVLNCSCCTWFFVSIYLHHVIDPLLSQPYSELAAVLDLRSVMPLTVAQVRNAITSSPWTKDFRHMEPFPISYLKRYSFKDMMVKAVKPQNRIKYWNIVPGDRVKIVGDKAGQVLEVAKVNKLSNRVYLKGASTNVRRCPNSAPLSR